MLKNLISPALSLGLIKGEIAKKLNKKVDSYQILFREEKINGFSLFFIVDNLHHPFEDEGKISGIIKEQLKDQVPDKNIDAFLITYVKEKDKKADIKAKIFYSYEDSNGKRIKECIENKI